MQNTKKDLKFNTLKFNLAAAQNMEEFARELATEHPEDYSQVLSMMTNQSNVFKKHTENVNLAIRKEAAWAEKDENWVVNIEQAASGPNKVISQKWFADFVKNEEMLNAINDLVNNKILLTFKSGTGQTETSIVNGLLETHKTILKQIVELLEKDHVNAWSYLGFPDEVSDSEIDLCIQYYKFILLKDMRMIWAMQNIFERINHNMGEPLRCLMDYTVQQAVEQNNFDIVIEMCEILCDYNPLFSYRNVAFQDRVFLDLLCYDSTDVEDLLKNASLNPEANNIDILELAKKNGLKPKYERSKIVDNINKYLVRSLDSFFETTDGSIFSYRIGWIEMDHILDEKYGCQLQKNMERYNENKDYSYKGDPDTFINDERNLIPATVMFHKDRSHLEYDSLWGNTELKERIEKRDNSVVGQKSEWDYDTIIAQQASAVWALKRYLVTIKVGETIPGFFTEDYPVIKNYIISEFMDEINVKKKSRHAQQSSNEEYVANFLKERKKLIKKAKDQRQAAKKLEKKESRKLVNKSKKESKKKK